MSAGSVFARLIATWFGCGRSPVAPGTVGTLGTLPLCYGLYQLGYVAYWSVTVVLTVLGVWASARTAEELGVEDPSSVVIDEVSGTLIAVGIGALGGLIPAALGVVLFRLFDIWKPGPIDNAQSLPGGYGIMADDVLAGVAAGLVAVGLSPLLP